MVIGPTPPGTGVIAPATSHGAVEIDVAHQPRLAVARSIRLMPTSITVAPGLIQSPVIISGRPTAATRISARRQTAGRSRVRLCAIVTVQLSPSSSCAIGLPTMFDRPTTTASSPDSCPDVAQHHQAAQRRAGHHRLLPGAQQPDIRDVEAVDVLGRDRSG
jgi:hypothetical protein